ncbi:MAG TPA: glycosyltransferase [Bryobacteraceae bacterium]|jgi:glycosyltransferase involved in cell wall biosynthesis|nr:glycosyltransferase [Bryobacteraceae bacterium]
MSNSHPADRKVCLIIPCYNEAGRINLQSFRDFLQFDHDTFLLFVDDGSKDNTSDVLERLAVDFPNVAHVLRLPQNRGKAEAVRHGILYALDRIQPEIIGFWDADLATPLNALNDFLAILVVKPEIEMVFGARVQLLGRHVQRSATRHYLGRIFATTVSVALRLAIYDTQCGAKLFRVTSGTRQIFAEPFLSKWVFDVEIIARYHQLFFRESRRLSDVIYEFPLERWTDVAGSKVQPADFFIAFRDVFRIWRKYKTGSA